MALGDNADEGFINYVPTTVNPGDTMLIGSVLFSLLLTILLPCLVAIGKRLQCVEHASDPNSSGDDTASSNGDEKNKDSHHDANHDVHSIHSTRSIHSSHTHVSSVVSGVVRALLDASPHGGPLRNTKQFVVQKKHHRDNKIQEDDETAAASVMGRLSHDEVSIRDAVDDDARRGGGGSTVGGGTSPIKPNATAEQQNDSVFSSSNCTTWDRLMLIAEFDYESKRLCKLAVPFISQALMEGIMEAVRVAIIGRFIGTNALLAYLAVYLLVGLTTSLLGGFQEALTTLCSQTLGSGNRKLAGQYVQIATILFVLCFIPVCFLWMMAIGPAVTWLGFNDEVRRISEEFTLFCLFAEFVGGVHNSAHSLLDVMGKENYSTLFYLVSELVGVAALLVLALKYNDGTDSLQTVGLLFVILEAAGLVINTMVIVWNGWFDRFLGGMVGGLALLNVKATRTLIGTAASLSVGEFLAYSEWELLTFFASFLGPAEVAVWGLLGTIWTAVELVTEAVADAAEVRVSFLLGSGQPARAKISAYKAIFLALFTAILMTSMLFIGGEDISTWLTTDPTLQRMTSELLPLFGLGNIALTVGTVAWTIVGSQGRYRLATAVAFSGSWLIGVPLAGFFSAVLAFDLKGQTAALVLGYMISGTMNSYVLFQSDWPKLSRRVIEIAAAANADNESDDDSSSSSSSSSSGDSAATPKSSNKIPTGGGSEPQSPIASIADGVTATLDGISDSITKIFSEPSASIEVTPGNSAK